MKVKALIEELQKLEAADECEVFVVIRHGVRLDPTVIGTEQARAYVSALNLIGRCVVLDTYVPMPGEIGR